MTVVIGAIIVPSLTVITRNWFVLGWTTILIGSSAYLCLPFIPESPRWLLNKGWVDEVIQIIKTISRWNGTQEMLQDNRVQDMLRQMNTVDATEENPNSGETICKLFCKETSCLSCFLDNIYLGYE